MRVEGAFLFQSAYHAFLSLHAFTCILSTAKILNKEDQRWPWSF